MATTYGDHGPTYGDWGALYGSEVAAVATAPPSGGGVRYQRPQPKVVKRRSRVRVQVVVVSTWSISLPTKTRHEIAARSHCTVSVATRSEHTTATSSERAFALTSRSTPAEPVCRSTFLRGVPHSYRNQRDEQELLLIASAL